MQLSSSQKSQISLSKSGIGESLHPEGKFSACGLLKLENMLRVQRKWWNRQRVTIKDIAIQKGENKRKKRESLIPTNFQMQPGKLNYISGPGMILCDSWATVPSSESPFLQKGSTCLQQSGFISLFLACSILELWQPAFIPSSLGPFQSQLAAFLLAITFSKTLWAIIQLNTDITDRITDRGKWTWLLKNELDCAIKHSQHTKHNRSEFLNMCLRHVCLQISSYALEHDLTWKSSVIYLLTGKSQNDAKRENHAAWRMLMTMKENWKRRKLLKSQQWV
jgi:hypothetical protein